MITTLSGDALTLDRGGRRLFEGLSFQLRAGEALALTGPNGAGKTSLLRAVAGLLRPAEGAVRFSGPGGDLDPPDARAAGLHWLGAQDGLKAGRTAEEELRFWGAWTCGSSSSNGEQGSANPRRAGVSDQAPHAFSLPEWGGWLDGAETGGGGRSTPRRRWAPPRSPTLAAARPSLPTSGEGDAVGAALAALGLAEHARTAVRRLSTGQRRRLALARLLTRPRALWLLDEPLAPLDAGWRARVGELMRAHLDGGGLILAAVHDPLPVPHRTVQVGA